MKNVICVVALMMCVFLRGQIIDIPDANFKNALVNTKCADFDNNGTVDNDVDENNDGEIEIDEAKKVINLYLTSRQITQLIGIEHFNSLYSLECQNNQLSQLTLSNLSALYYINCSSNQLSQLTLSNLPALKYLICENNQLSQLTLSNLPALSSLECNNNKLTELTLSNLPVLSSLGCNNNKLTQLTISNLPALSNLYCSQNQLTQLTISNLLSIFEIRCSYNNLTQLTLSNLPALKYLDCVNNQLAQLTLSDLPALSSLHCNNNQLSQLTLSNLPALKYLICANNQLAQLTLSNLPALSNLYCDNNKLTQLTLINLPSLDNLYCRYNQLTQLSISGLRNMKIINLHENPLINIFAKFGQKINFTESEFPPSIEYVCTDEINTDWFKTKISKANINTYCSFTPGGEFFSILGNTIYDHTKDGCNNNDINYPNLKFKISSSNAIGSFISDKSGSYFISILEGNHTIKPILEYPNYFTVSPDSITVSFPSTSDNLIQNFCIIPKNILRQIDLSIIPIDRPARPGFNTQYKVVMTNEGNQVENGTLNFNYDEARLDFVSSDVTPTTQTDGWLTWDFKNLFPFETRYYNVTLKVNKPTDTPPVNAGDELIINCSILDNVFSLKQTVVGSYDPNDKTCLEGNKITPEQVGKYIHYLIRFENTGNYAAENIVVKDVIDESTFDLSSLQITDASHKAWARINNNIVEFIFENIQLPFDDANNDGYIAFKIKTKPSLQLGNELKNEANIYFDYNKPILTNKTNTVIAIPDATDEALGSSEVEVFPNPVSDVLKFNTDEKIHKVEIYDVSGRLVQVSSVVNDEVNVEGLLSGTYQLKVFTHIGVRNSKMVKI